MAYTSTITLCVQPIGQIVYGFLFDRFYDAIYLCLLPTGVIVCIVGLSAMGFFKDMEKQPTLAYMTGFNPNIAYSTPPNIGATK